MCVSSPSAYFWSTGMTRCRSGTAYESCRPTLSAYDAQHVALSEALDVPLLTADSHIARAEYMLPVDIVPEQKAFRHVRTRKSVEPTARPLSEIRQVYQSVIA
jgi:hypothetical protein